MFVLEDKNSIEIIFIYLFLFSNSECTLRVPSVNMRIAK